MSKNSYFEDTIKSMIMEHANTDMEQVFEHTYKQQQQHSLDEREMCVTVFQIPDDAGFMAVLISYELDGKLMKKIKFHGSASADTMGDILRKAADFMGTEY